MVNSVSSFFALVSGVFFFFILAGGEKRRSGESFVLYNKSWSLLWLLNVGDIKEFGGFPIPGP